MNPLDYEIEKWRNYADVLGFVKPEQAEKDYLQELLLFELYSGKLSNLFLFRGGTAISKFYGSGRFSEDIDLILTRDIDKSEIENYIETSFTKLNLYYNTEYKMKAYRNMLKYELKIKGPIHSVANNEQAKQTIRLDLNMYERSLTKPTSAFRTTIYEDLKPYTILVASKEELLADKIKAIVERTKPVARDLYDAWLLINKYKIKPDLNMVDNKMITYGKEKEGRFSITVLKKRIKQMENIWNSELSHLMHVIPEYATVKREFENSLS